MMGNGLKKIAKSSLTCQKVTFTHKERKNDGVSKKGPQCEVKGTRRMVMRETSDNVWGNIKHKL
jgi:hypothetical protein